MDRLTKEHRSWNMSRIRGKDTRPELKVRSLLHGLRYRFRLHQPGLPGRPDIVLPKHRAALLVHGCFWHRHEGCRYAYRPKSRLEFWAEKFDANIRRDRKVIAALRKLGWRVRVVWECELRDPVRLESTLSRWLKDSGSRQRLTGRPASASPVAGSRRRT
jgi:DNA mismatch endonuclease (patch repair protein)